MDKNLLNKNNLNQIIDLLKKDYPKIAVNISEAFALVSLELDDLYDLIKDEIAELLNKEKMDLSADRIEFSKSILGFRGQADALSEALIDSIEEEALKEDFEGAEKANSIINYEDYLVDYTVEYDLFYDYTHKRPHAFILNGVKHEATTMRDILITTCKILAKENYKIIEKFVDDPRMKGRKISYFGKKLIKEKGTVRNALIPNTDIYVWTNQSANSIRNLLRKILRRYDYALEDFKIFLRADYSEAHEKNTRTNQKNID